MPLTTWTRASAAALWLLPLLLTASAAFGQGNPALLSWKAIDKLVEDQKAEAAAQATEARLARAKGGGDEAEWTRALVRTVQLRTGLHGYETAVRFLREQPWPRGMLPRATLNLFYAHALVTYAQQYDWEVRQREPVASSGPVDLKAWTSEQIRTEALRAYEEVWKERQELGTEPVKVLAEYLEPNTYPEGIRSTLRDAVSYLLGALLADSSHWSPEHANATFRLDLGPLLEGTPAVALLDPSVHPLVKVAAVLGDLEDWHRAAGRREAALEARLKRYEVLHRSFTADGGQRRIRQHLSTHLEAFRDVPWWAMGQGLLAELERDEDHLVRAHTVARACAGAWPESLGGRRCRTVVDALEGQKLEVEAMQVDGPHRRSIQVVHRNLRQLHFRAYDSDLEARVTTKQEVPDTQPKVHEVERILQAERPVAAWTVPLPPVGDFREHTTYVTPPLSRMGTYLIVASVSEGFEVKDNRVVAVYVTLSPWVALIRGEPDKPVVVQVVRGETGQPAAGVEVRLMHRPYEPGPQVLARATTNPQGEVSFTRPEGEVFGVYLVVGRGREVVVPSQGVWFEPSREPEELASSLVFTDRSVYRPQQKVRWKVVAFRGHEAQGRYQAVPGETLQVLLVDPNRQVVEQREVLTNDFGSAAGEFTIPTGRLLGHWQVRVEQGGEAAIRVEEYKRPTFEVTLKDPETPLRINQPATFLGEARYYFGLPVGSGQVRWRAFRQPLGAWWWGWRQDRSLIGSEVAKGTAQLAADGSFRITFTPEAEERYSHLKEMTWRYLIEVEATDAGGETRSASRAFRLGFVAVEGRADLDEGFILQGAVADVRLTRSTLDGVPQAGPGRWRLVALKQPARPVLPADEPVTRPRERQVDPDVVHTPTPGDSQHPRWESRDTPKARDVLGAWKDGHEQARGTVHHDRAGVAWVRLRALKPGAYRLYYETEDAFGQTFTLGRELLVAGERAPAALPVALVLQKESVRVGERARVLAFSGIEGLPLVLEVSQGRRSVLRRELVGGRGPVVLEVPVTEALRGGFRVALTGVRDWQLLHAEQDVSVPWDDKALDLEFATFRDRLSPGGRETWRVTVRGPKGAKVEAGAAELLAYMYDQSLDLFDSHVPASVARLYRQRRHHGPRLDASLGVARPEWYTDRHSRPGPLRGWEPPREDALRFEDGYALGGPGARHGTYPGRRDGGPKRRAPAPSSRTVASRGPEALLMPAPVGGRQGPAPDKGYQAGGDAPVAALRSDFAETAFWVPQLLTGPDGSVVLEFTVPDSVTAWSVWVHALTRDLRGGSVQRTARSVKELMVRPYVPRFLREGDRAVLEVVVNNAADEPQQGTLTLDIVDPQTQKSLLADFGVQGASQAFTVEAGQGTSLRFALTTPAKVGPVAFRVEARTGSFSDGELRPLPVLPGRMHLAQSRFVALKGRGSKTMTFEELRQGGDPTRIHEQLVVTVDSQLFYAALQALPYLVTYCHETTEGTLNRFVPTAILSSLYDRYPAVAKLAQKLSERSTRLEMWDTVDPNRRMTLEETPWLELAGGGAGTAGSFPGSNVLDPKVASAVRNAALRDLRVAQTGSGGFPWWPGGPPSPHMTLYILHGLSRALEYGATVPPEMTRDAWAFLSQHVGDEYLDKRMKQDEGWELITFLNYVLSAYPDASYTGEVFTAAERKQLLDFSYKHWKEHSPYLKGYLALALKRAGRDADATRVWDSVMDSAKTTEELGTYWAPEERSWLWYNDTTETHAFALRTLTELKPKDPRREGLVQWLLLDKKLNHWKSTRATAEAIYALVKYLEAEGALGVREDAKVTVGPRVVQMEFSPDEYTGKKNQVVVAGPELKPETMSQVVVEKTTPGFAFASATWHFSTEKLPEEDRGDFFQVSRRYFRRGSEGQRTVLQPLAEGAVLKPGDEVEVQLSLRTKHAAEYVHLRDPRAAGLEPEDVQSRHKWDLGIVWYEETRDSGTHFFFEWLPAGEYTFKYRLRANMAGTFRVGPATVQSMYAPEFTAYSTGAVLTVGPAK